MNFDLYPFNSGATQMEQRFLIFFKRILSDVAPSGIVREVIHIYRLRMQIDACQLVEARHKAWFLCFM